MSRIPRACLVLLLGLSCLGGSVDPALKMFTIVPGADIVLKDEYGVLLVNDGGETNPVPRYILAIKSSRTIVDTRDIHMFRGALEQIPKGSTVYRYDSCTVPRSYGLTEKQQGAFARCLREAGLNVPPDEIRGTCYCEAIKNRKANKVMQPTR